MTVIVAVAFVLVGVYMPSYFLSHLGCFRRRQENDPFETEERKMIHLYGDYYTESDGCHNIIFYKRGVVSGNSKKGEPVKKANVGKEKYDPVGYYGTITSMLDGLSRKLMIEILANENVRDLKDAVDRLNAIIDSLSFTIKVNGEDKEITAKMMSKDI